MNYEYFFNKIAKITQLFEPIVLSEMDEVKLMERVDVKYLIPLNILPQILEEAVENYRLLIIDNQGFSAYETLYYDTSSLQLYHQHQAKKLNRFKLRSRKYIGSNLQFFEVKQKNNKGRTIKNRIETTSLEPPSITNETGQYLGQLNPLIPKNFQSVLWVNYTRLTFVNKYSLERLTIDLNLTFKNEYKQIQYSQLAIAEVKQVKMGNSPIINILKKHRLKPGFISKYCFGVISLFEGIKQNNFKKQLKNISKIILQYDTHSASCIA